MLQVAKQADASPQGTDHLYKVLRTCAQWELLIELPGKKFSANAATSALVRDGPPSLGHLAAHQINKPKQQAWQVIPGSCPGTAEHSLSTASVFLKSSHFFWWEGRSTSSLSADAP